MKAVHSKGLVILSICIVFFLSGCMYPEQELSKQIPYENMIKQVQDAVDQFQEDNDGLLPIKTKDSDTDYYVKYLIDFDKLVPRYLPDIPVNAYEKGGLYQYTIIDPEENPTVKVFDLTIAETIRDIKLRLSYLKYPPFKERITKNVFTLDFKKLGYDEDPSIISPFSGQNLYFVISTAGEIYLDYSSDLYLTLQKLENVPFSQGDDVRSILTENSFFVPAFSLPYTIDENGEPIFIEKN